MADDDFGFVAEAPSSTGTDDFGFVAEAQQQPPRTSPEQGKFNSNTIALDTRALPFSNLPSAAAHGYEQGQKLLGDNLLGKGVGAVFGAAEGLGTAFNPITEGLGDVIKGVQAGSEALSGEGANATRTLTGERPILPAYSKVHAYNTGSPTLDTVLNTSNELAMAVQGRPDLLLGLKGGKAKAALEASIEASKPKPQYHMNPEVGSPLINTKIAPNKAGDHFIEPKDAMNDSQERLLSKAVPAQGAPRNSIKTSDSIKNGAMEVFRLDPSIEGSGNIGGAMQTIADHASPIYEKFQAIGEARPDINLSTKDVTDSITNNLGDAPSTELRAMAKSDIGQYPETITLPGAILKLKQINGELAPLIRTADYGAKYQLLTAQAKALRRLIDPKIDEIGGTQAVKLRQTYGNLTEYAKALGKQIQKVDRNIPADLRGSLNDAVGTGEMLAAGIHLAHAGINPLSAIAAFHGAMKMHKAYQKAFWTNPDRMLGKWHAEMTKKIGRPGDVPTPKGFLPELTLEEQRTLGKDELVKRQAAIDQQRSDQEAALAQAEALKQYNAQRTAKGRMSRESSAVNVSEGNPSQGLNPFQKLPMPRADIIGKINDLNLQFGKEIAAQKANKTFGSLQGNEKIATMKKAMDFLKEALRDVPEISAEENAKHTYGIRLPPSTGLPYKPSFIPRIRPSETE